MTIPISPVDIHPSVLAAPQENGVAMLLAALQHRQQLDLQRAKLRQDQEEFAMRSKLMGTQIVGNELENEKRKRELKLQEEDLLAQDTALQLATGNAMRLSDSAGLGEVIANIKDPMVAKHFIDYMKDFGALESQAAGTQVAQNAAKVSTAGLPQDVTQATSGRDPERVAQWRATWETGLFTAGQAAHLAGIALPPDVDASAMVPPELLKNRIPKLSQDQRRAKTFYETMSTAGPLINRLVDQTGGLTTLGSVARSAGGEGFFTNLLAIAANKMLPPEQQQLVQAHQIFSDSWRYFVSGQQTSDKEGAKIMKYTVEQAGDTPEVKRQKRQMRDMMIQTVKDAAESEASPASALQQLVLTAAATGMSGDRVEYLRSQLLDAQSYERQRRSGRLSIDQTPTTADSFPSRIDRARQLIDSAVP